MGKRAAIYVRVSTDKQTVENQVRELRQIAFSKSASTWRNSPIRLGRIEPIAILLHYVPLRPWRKCRRLSSP
jgi:hypothetical protein